jgi:hypothetical protein
MMMLAAVRDNGVVSNEFWRILDCADDLSWAVFYYSGAASAAGTSYTGSLVVTPDGRRAHHNAASSEAGLDCWLLCGVVLD